jgi:hypothetical protein
MEVFRPGNRRPLAAILAVDAVDSSTGWGGRQRRKEYRR